MLAIPLDEALSTQSKIQHSSCGVTSNISGYTFLLVIHANVMHLVALATFLLQSNIQHVPLHLSSSLYLVSFLCVQEEFIQQEASDGCVSLKIIKRIINRQILNHYNHWMDV